MKHLPFTIISLSLLIGCSPVDKHTFSAVYVASGTVERIDSFASEFIPARNVDVWLPDGYSEDQEYAVLYMHDGQMLFDSTTTWNKQEWTVDEKMGRLLDQEELQNTIVVGIWNTEFRHSEYFPQIPFLSLPQAYQDSLLQPDPEDESGTLFKSSIASDDYLRFLVQELKPAIDQQYATLPDQEHTFIAGSSMGGLISMYAICEYPEVFGGAACLSTHWIGIFDTVNNPIPQAFEAYLEEHLPDPRDHKLYFDYGTETLDAFYEPFQLNIDTVMMKGDYTEQNWSTRKFEGADHSERAWASRLEIPLTFLLGNE